MHSAVVSSVRIFWNGCQELSDKERVHELKGIVIALLHHVTNVETDTFFSPSYQVYQTDVILLYEKYENIIAFRVTPHAR